MHSHGSSECYVGLSNWLDENIKSPFCRILPNVGCLTTFVGVVGAGAVLCYFAYKQRGKQVQGSDQTITKILKVLKPDNPNCHTILKYLIEKSAFRDDQEIMIEGGVIQQIESVIFEFDDSEIRQMLRLLTNLSTNPKAIPALQVLIPRTNGLLLKYRESLLSDLLGLYVNLSSHEELVIAVNISNIPYLLSNYTKLMKHDIVLKCLKILINATLSQSFSSRSLDIDLVVVSLLRILYECKNTTVTLRALTLLRNIMNNPSVSNTIDERYHTEIVECVQNFMSESNVDSLHL